MSGDRPDTINHHMKKQAVKYLRIAFGVFLLLLILNSVEFHVLEQRFASINITLFCFIIIIGVMDRILMAFKWKLLMDARGVPVSLLKSTRLYYVAHLFGTFTPGGLGAEAYRVMALDRNKKKVVASTIVVERAIGLLTTLLFAFIALPFSFHHLGASARQISLLIFFGTIIFLFALYLSLKPDKFKKAANLFPCLTDTKIIKKVREFYYVYAEYRFHKVTLLLFLLLTSCELLLIIIMNYIAAITLGVTVNFLYFLSVLPILHLLLRIPVTFQGFGVQEGLFAYFVVLAGFTAADGVAISVLLRIGELVYLIIPATFIFWISPFRVEETRSIGK